MRTAMAVGMMLLVMKLGAAEKVVVYVDNQNVVDMLTLGLAEGLASKMFARIGVSIEWRPGMPPREDTAATVVHMVSKVPEQLHRGALGYTVLQPHSGAQVFVLAGRVGQTGDPILLRALLAHVMVHEVTHALEGLSRHAETGVMKAHWTGKDYGAMTRKALMFTPVDVGIIHSRLAQR
jgi:hypothetical protein